MQSPKLHIWMLISLGLPVLFFAFACTTPGADRPLPTPTLARVRDLPPQSELPLGPLLSQGAYCWKDLHSNRIYIRLALFNPTQSPVRFRIDPYGTGIVRALESTMTDPLDIGPTSECRYKVEVRRDDESNSYLGQDYELLFNGVTLLAPDRASLRLVKRYFSDLQAGDVASLQTYVNPSITVQRLATSITWRAGIGPVTFQVKDCSPRFKHDPLSRGSFSVLAYDCSASVVYSVFSQPPGPGTWNGLVTTDFVEKKMTLYPDVSEQR